MSELKKKMINSKAFPRAENLLHAILLKADFFYQHRFDDENSFVCSSHRSVLLQQVYATSFSYKKCDACLNVRAKISHSKTDLRHISVSQAITLCEIFHLKNSFGKLICRNCQVAVSNKTDETRKLLYQEAFECLFDPESICCAEDSIKDRDVNYEPPHDLLINENLNERITALNNFLAACASKKAVNVTESYKGLSHRVKPKYIRLVKFIMQSATSLIASDDAGMLMRDSFGDIRNEHSNIVLDGKFRQIMHGISEAYKGWARMNGGLCVSRIFSSIFIRSG